jgi:hypothetical protein
LPPPPTATLATTPSPPAINTAPADNVRGGVATPAPASRSAGGALRIQLALIQHAAVSTPSATIQPTARAQAAPATLPPAAPAPATATPPPRQAAPDDDPTRNYPYFGGTAAFLLAGWALLRRGRARRSL